METIIPCFKLFKTEATVIKYILSLAHVIQ